MRHLGIVGLAIMALTACATEGDGEVGAEEQAAVSSAARPFDLAEMAPRAKATFAAPSGRSEVCVIAGRFSEDGYGRKDRKKEEKLCKADWYAAVGAEGATPAGLAPKANSTNPAVDVHEVSAANPREVVESFAEANARDRKAKKIGRIKSSLDHRFDRTSTYAPSIFGYYVTSRLLGNIGEVTPAVWRTIEVPKHVKVAETGTRLTVPGSQIVKTMWAQFVRTDSAAEKSPLFYTSDGGQVYGAFIPNVSGDEKDKEIDTQAGLTSSPRFKRLVDGRPIAGTIATDFKSAVETIVPMQGVTEMLVLDALMLQGDRLSGDNVSYVNFMFFQDADGSVDRMSEDDYLELAEEGAPQPAGAIKVRKLYLNDVDAGLIVKNAESFQNGSEYALLKKVAHLSPDLYARVRKLAASVQDPAFERYMKSELRYTDRDWVRYSTMAGAVSTLLHDRCAAGQLTLDLDVQRHVAKTNLGPRRGCE